MLKNDPKRSMKGVEIQKSMMEIAPEFLYPERGRGIVHIRTILLGQTKYYQAVPDTNPKNTDKLIFREMRETSDWKLGGDSVKYTVSPEYPSCKLGVYYEYKDDTDSSLAGDMIRLVGRYWTADTTFTVRLKADSKDGKRHGEIVIGVMKPDKLGNTHRTIMDVFGHTIDLDSLIIKFAGENGIPPQLIKAQIEQESADPITHRSFDPIWRYEPIIDLNYQNNADIKNKFFPAGSPFVKDATHPKATGSWPSHSNVHPSQYIDSALSIGKFIADNWNRNRIIGTEDEPDSIINSVVLTDEWNNIFRKKLKLLSIEDAKGSTYDSLGRVLSDTGKEFTKSNKFNLIAQTRIVTSYGLTQMMYTTAIDDSGRFFKETDSRYALTGTPYMLKLNSSDYPEMLSELDTLMPRYCDFLLRNLNRLFPDRIPPSLWSGSRKIKGKKGNVIKLVFDGFDTCWKGSLYYYNSRGCYGQEVMDRIKKYLPK